MPEPILNLETLCAIEIGVILAALSNGVLALQISRYFHKNGNDPPLLRRLILFIWLVTVAHLALAVSTLHFTTISEHGDSTQTTVFPPSFSALVVVGAIAHSSVQAIYTHRFHIIPGCWGFPILFWTLSVYILGSAVAYTAIWVVASSGVDGPSLLDHWSWIFTSHLSVAAGADVFICISTCWCLARPSNGTLKRTQRLLNRIMLRIIQTGLATSMMSICVAIMFATCQPRAIWMGLYFPLVPCKRPRYSIQRPKRRS
ncbi:hypothetical protein BD779DRAFT_567191 [Infundibulicybe gibba]|nr:hypothetical protein BD779DRAFT_567191 [Infundibulicybe gibba]